MELHIPTLLVCVTISEVLFTAVVVAVWSVRRLEPALVWWGLASLLMALGFVGVAMRNQVPDWLSIVVANFFVYEGLALYWAGMRIFAGQSRQLGWCLVPPLVQSLLWVWREPLGLDVNHRVVISSVLGAMYSLLILLNALRTQRNETLVTRHVVIVIAGLQVLNDIARGMDGALGGFHTDQYMAPNAFHALLLMNVMTLFSLLNIGCFMMAFERHENRLILAATLDSLTSLLNRAGFMQLAERQRQRSERDGEPVSVLVMDLDLFKTINDTYGHEAGDAAICAFARCARTALRPTDLLSRPGGEEFWALLPNTALDEASRIAQRLCDQFRGAPLQYEGRTIATTVSIGAAEVSSGGESIQAALSRADQALYVAKREGRNRVSAALRPSLTAQAMQSG